MHRPVHTPAAVALRQAATNKALRRNMHKPLHLLVYFGTCDAAAFTARRITAFHGSARAAVSMNDIEFQRDCGRGPEHLSARLVEGDVCVYQVGTWMVDWSPVGSGNPPRLLLVRCDCLQLNWTMTHEHGRILATAINRWQGEEVRIDEDEEYAGVEFGPEQLVARVGADWEDDFVGRLRAVLPDELPACLLEEQELPVETGRFEGPGLG